MQIKFSSIPSLIFLNKQIYFFRKKKETFFQNLNIYRAYNTKSKNLNTKIKIRYNLFRIRYKTRLNIKRILEYYKKYQSSCLEDNMKNVKFFVGRQSKRIFIFNMLLKYYKKDWYYRINFFENYSSNKSIKQKSEKFLKNHILIEKLFLMKKQKIQKFLTQEKKFFLSFFLNNYKIDLKMNSMLYLIEKKNMFTNSFFPKKKIVYITHQKIIGFAPVCFTKQKTLRSNSVLLGKNFKNLI